MTRAKAKGAFYRVSTLRDEVIKGQAPVAPPADRALLVFGRRHRLAERDERVIGCIDRGTAGELSTCLAIRTLAGAVATELSTSAGERR